MVRGESLAGPERRRRRRLAEAGSRERGAKVGPAGPESHPTGPTKATLSQAALAVWAEPILAGAARTNLLENGPLASLPGGRATRVKRLVRRRR